jgi:hypothetical protein
VRLVLAVVAAALTVGATTTARPLPSLTCSNAIEIPDEQPPPADALVLDRVELPRADEVLQLGPPPYRGAPLFAKRGVAVTAGAPVVLEVRAATGDSTGSRSGAGPGSSGPRPSGSFPAPAP